MLWKPFLFHIFSSAILGSMSSHFRRHFREFWPQNWKCLWSSSFSSFVMTFEVGGLLYGDLINRLYFTLLDRLGLG